MATSGTSVFNIDIIEIIGKAYQRAGLESRTGFDMRSARLSLDLMALEWQNRGINLWTVEERELPLKAGQGTYTLEPDIIDLVEHVTRQNTGTQQIDYQMTRISLPTYATRSNKLVKSRPTEIYVDRQRDAPVITLWSVPSDDSYRLVYWVMRRIQDAGVYTNTFDAPARFLPALTAGLAHYTAMERPKEVTLDDRNRLEIEYEKQFDLAAGEDREKASLRAVPHVERVV